jgi:glycosyltransferase involved in cell wall biosynthesis
MLRRRLQRWDLSSNSGVHDFVAISRHVAQRIHRYYGRNAFVVYPPVDWQSFQASEKDDGFYLMVTAFAPYKRVDLAIEAFNRLGVPLKIIGSGQDERRLKSTAGPTVELLGWGSDEMVRDYYGRCKAVIFPGEEDFGIVPLEAMACGKPVIAYGKGGVLETVLPINPGDGRDGSTSPDKQPTGVFFYEPTTEALAAAVRLFERHRKHFDPQAIRAHAAPFDRPMFKDTMRRLIAARVSELCSLRPC